MAIPDNTFNLINNYFLNCISFIIHIFKFAAPTQLVSTILGVPNLHRTIVFLACLFVIIILYSLLFIFSCKYIYFRVSLE